MERFGCCCRVGITMNTKIVHFREQLWDTSKGELKLRFSDELSFSIIYQVDVLPRSGGKLINYDVAFKHPNDVFNKKVARQVLEERLSSGVKSVPLFIPKSAGTMKHYDYVITILADILATNSFVSNRRKFIKNKLMEAIENSLHS